MYYNFSLPEALENGSPGRMCLSFLLLVINVSRTLTGSGGYNALTAAPSVSSVRAITDGEHEDREPERKPKSMLVISGGEGYIDFRIG